MENVRRVRQQHIPAPIFKQLHQLDGRFARRRTEPRHIGRIFEGVIERNVFFFRVGQQAVLRHFAQAAGGRIDDAQQADVVGRVNQNARVAHHILNFFAVVEAHRPDQAVRDLIAAEIVFKAAALCVGAVEHGNFF